MGETAFPLAGPDAITDLRRQYNHPRQEGDHPLGIEYLAAHGRAIEYFWVRPSQALEEDERLKGQPLDSLKLFQRDTKDWELQLRAVDSQQPLVYEYPEEQLAALLAQAGEKLYAQPPKGQEWDPTAAG